MIEMKKYLKSRKNPDTRKIPEKLAKSRRSGNTDRDQIFDYSGFVGSSDFRPCIIDINTNGEKQLKMALPVINYRPEQIKVSVKNNELIVQAENIYNDNNRSERSFLTKSISLPLGTNAEQLRSFLNTDGQLEIEAPFIEPNQARSIEVQRL